MKYLLFINFNNGLMHNSIYNTLNDVYESITQLVQEEKLETNTEGIPSEYNMKRHLQKNDDYFGNLSNGTWYHIQPYPVFG